MGRKSNYFRHTFDAHNDDKIISLIEKKGVAGVGVYFILLEFYGSQYNNDDDKKLSQNISVRRLSSATGLRKDALHNHLNALCQLRLIESLCDNYDDTMVQLRIPNFLKYFGYFKKADEVKVPKEKKRKEKKEKEIKEKKNEHESSLDFLEKITPQEIVPKEIMHRVDLKNDNLEKMISFGQKNCRKLFEKFPSDFIFEEIDSMEAWLLDHKDRKFSYQFVLNWLKRGYDIEKHGPSELSQEIHNLKMQELDRLDDEKRGLLN